MQRHSRQRDAVFEALCSVRSHPTALQVFDMVRSSIPNISLATVYRNLKGLVEEGKAIVLLSNDSVEHYDAVVNRHYHMCCDKCDKVYDIESNINIDLDGLNTPHKINSVNVMFNGICQNCLN